MALINRLSRLFKADFHAVLDQIEEPGQLLNQAIRDMEDSLNDAGQRIALCAHDQEVLTVQKHDLVSAVKEFDAQLDLCFESGKDDLAKSLIKKKLEAERLGKHLQSKHAANELVLDEQRVMFDENRMTLDGLRQKAEIFARRTPSHAEDHTAFDDLAWTAGGVPGETNIGDDEVEIAYLHEKNLRSAS